jgi:antitoxin (DNA-binding transcriptional repressor) of toxin-antitoxin stability system
MSSVTVQELQRDPVRLLNRVEAGESILVTRGNRAVAELRPIPVSGATPRPFGLAAGEFVVPADFDSPLPEDVLQGFESR